MPFLPTPIRSTTYRLTLLAVLFAALTSPARAQADDEPEWGNTPGLAEPRPDSKGRAGHWWWPKGTFFGEAASHGNGGRVFGQWLRKVEPSEVAEHEPPLPLPDPLSISVVVPKNILFDFDSAKLKHAGKVEADKVVAELLKFGRDTVICIGHTDDMGSDTYNMTLGERRAQAVKDYIVAAGVNDNRVAIKSMGETDPAVPNDSPSNRALNRRVVLQFTVVN